MKTILKSHITHIVMLALLCVGGSAQAKVNMSSTLLKKSFGTAHPVLKWGGMGLATGAVVFLGVEGYRAYTTKNDKGFFKTLLNLIKSDLGCARKVVYAKRADLIEIQREIAATKKEITERSKLLSEMSGEALKNLRVKLVDLEKREKALAKRFGSLTLSEKKEKEKREVESTFDVNNLVPSLFDEQGQEVPAA